MESFHPLWLNGLFQTLMKCSPWLLPGIRGQRCGRYFKLEWIIKAYVPVLPCRNLPGELDAICSSVQRDSLPMSTAACVIWVTGGIFQHVPKDSSTFVHNGHFKKEYILNISYPRVRAAFPHVVSERFSKPGWPAAGWVLGCAAPQGCTVGCTVRAQCKTHCQKVLQRS